MDKVTLVVLVPVMKAVAAAVKDPADKTPLVIIMLVLVVLVLQITF